MTYSFIPELRKGVDNDTKDNVETNGGHNDEEGHIIEQSQCSHAELLRNKRYNLSKEGNKKKLLNCTSYTHTQIIVQGYKRKMIFALFS